MAHRMYAAVVSLGSASLGLLAASITLHAVGCGISAEDLFNTQGKCVASLDDASPKCVCSTTADCPASTECMEWRCESNLCKANPKTGELALYKQVPGDCKRLTCAEGAIKDAIDDSDFPTSKHACMITTCADGNLHQEQHVAGTTCSEGQNVVCNAMGKCVRCLENTNNGCASGEVCLDPDGAGPQCMPGHCYNAIMDSDETGKNCGGSCKPCDLGGGCSGTADCSNKICAPSKVCCESICNGICRICAQGTGECEEAATGTEYADCNTNKVCAKNVGCVIKKDHLCNKNEECMSGNCIPYNMGLHICGPGAAGYPCITPSDCTSAHCESGTCS